MIEVLAPAKGNRSDVPGRLDGPSAALTATSQEYEYLKLSVPTAITIWRRLVSEHVGFAHPACAKPTEAIRVEVIGVYTKSMLIDIDVFGLRHAESSLVDKLNTYSTSPRFCADIDNASQLYWQTHRVAGTQTDGSFDRCRKMADLPLLRFRDWFIFDYRLRCGYRLIELFSRELRGKLNRYEHSLLERWIESYYGVFSIEADREAHYLTMTDVLDGRSVVVGNDGFASPDSLIAYRHLSLDAKSDPSGTRLVIDTSRAGTLVESLRYRYRRLLFVTPDVTVPQFYRLCGHLLDSLIGV